MKTTQTNNKTTLMRVLVLMMLLVAGVNKGAWAQSTFNGTINNEWGNPGNWSGGFPINTTAVTINANVILVAGTTIGSLTINAGFTLDTRAFDITIGGATIVRGTLTDTVNSGTNAFNGAVTVALGGSFTQPSATNTSLFIFQGNITNNGTFNLNGSNSVVFSTNPLIVTANTLMTFGIAVFANSNVTLVGAANINFNNFTVGAGTTVTNTNTSGVIFNGTLNGAATNSTFTNGTGVGNAAKVSIRGSFSPMQTGTFNAGLVDNTVIYDATTGSQAVRGNSYHNLIIGGGGGTLQARTLLANTIINGNLTIDVSSELSAGTNNVTLAGTFTNNGTFAVNNGGAGTFTIAGNLTNTGNFTGTNTFIFNGSTAQTITGTTTFNKLTINKLIGTTVTLSTTIPTNITVTNQLTLTDGRIVLGANNITANQAFSDTGAGWVETNGLGAFIDNSNATGGIIFPVGDAGARRFVNLNASSDPTSVGTSVRFIIGVAPTPIGTEVADGMWQIKGTGASNVNLQGVGTAPTASSKIHTSTVIPSGAWVALTTTPPGLGFSTGSTPATYITQTATGTNFTIFTPAPTTNDYYSIGNTNFNMPVGFASGWSNTLGSPDCNCSPAGNPNANVVIGAHTVTVQNATDIAGTATTITLANVASVLEFNAINTNPIGSLSGVAGSKIKMNVNALPVVANGSNAFIGTAGTIMEFASTTTGIIPIGFPNIPTPFPYKNVIISGGVTKNIAGDIIIDENLTINNTNTLGTNNKNINIKGNWINNGTFNAGTGTATVIFSSSANAQTIGGSNFPITSPFNNLIISNTFTTNPTVSIIASANELEVKGTLTLTNGRFVIGAKDLRLTNTPATQLSPTTFTSASTSYVETNGGGKLIRSSLPAGIDFQFPVGDDIAIRLATINRGVAGLGVATTCSFKKAAVASIVPVIPAGSSAVAPGTWNIAAQTITIDVTLLSAASGVGSLIHTDALGSWALAGTTTGVPPSYTTRVNSVAVGQNFTIFTPPATSNIFYSNPNTSGGNWNLAGSWSSTQTTFTATNVPTPNATVFIENGHTINVADVGYIAAGITINIATGGTLSFADGASGSLANNLIDNLNFATGAKVRVNNNILPVFSISNFGSTNGTIIEFAGTTTGTIPSQFISANYQNLIISGTGTKTLAADIIIERDLTIDGTLNAGNFNIDIKGNWIKNGVFNAGAGTQTVTFNSTALQTITGGGLYSFNNVVINNTVTASSAMTVNNITFASGVLNVTSSSIDVKGDFINDSAAMAAQTIVAAYVRFTGTGTQNISGTQQTNFGGLEIAGTANNINLARDINVRSYFRMLAGNTSTFNAGTFDINVSGNGGIVSSWTKEVNSGTFNAGIGTVIFNGTNAQTIVGVTDFNNLTINNSAGVTLTQSLTLPITISNISVAGTLNLASGRLITGTHTVTLGTSGNITRLATGGWINTNGGGKLSRTIGATLTDFPVGDNADLRLVQMSSATGGTATAGFVAGAPTNPTTNAINVFAGTWRLSSANPTVVAFTNAATAPDVKIRQQNVTLWDEVATTFMPGTPPTYMSTSAISVVSNATFALFEIGVPLVIPNTDINFVGISVNNLTNKIIFSWKTVVGAQSYNIRLGTIIGNDIVWKTPIAVATPAGNPANIDFVNADFEYDVNTYYSVQAVGATPATTSDWSKFVSIFISSINNPATSLTSDISNLIKISPNPSSGDFIVDFGAMNSEKSLVCVYNAQGKQVFISENNSNKMIISLGDFANGIYLAQISTEKGSIWKKIVKTN